MVTCVSISALDLLLCLCGYLHPETSLSYFNEQKRACLGMKKHFNTSLTFYFCCSQKRKQKNTGKCSGGISKRCRPECDEKSQVEQPGQMLMTVFTRSKNILPCIAIKTESAILSSQSTPNLPSNQYTWGRIVAWLAVTCFFCLDGYIMVK